MEEVKGQKACFAARAQFVPWAKMATEPVVLDSVPSQVTLLGPVPALARAASTVEASRQAISMFERNELGGKRSGGPENDPMTHRLNAGDKACCLLPGGKMA